MKENENESGIGIGERRPLPFFFSLVGRSFVRLSVCLSVCLSTVTESAKAKCGYRKEREREGRKKGCLPAYLLVCLSVRLVRPSRQARNVCFSPPPPLRTARLSFPFHTLSTVYAARASYFFFRVRHSRLSAPAAEKEKTQASAGGEWCGLSKRPEEKVCAFQQQPSPSSPFGNRAEVDRTMESSFLWDRKGRSSLSRDSFLPKGVSPALVYDSALAALPSTAS